MSGTKSRSWRRAYGAGKSAARPSGKVDASTVAGSKKRRLGDHLSESEEDDAIDQSHASDSELDEDSDNSDDERQAMLAMLEAHGRSMFGDMPSTAAGKSKAKAKGKGKAVAVERDEDDGDLDGWKGIEGSEDSDGEGSVYDEDEELSDAGELDDGEDLLASARSRAQRPLASSTAASTSAPVRPAKAVVAVVFQDPSRSSNRDDPSTALGLAGRKAFMAAQVNKPVVEQAAGKKRKTREEEEDESHLQSLDRSLASLITTFNSSTASTSKLQSLLSTNLAPPSVPSDPRNPQAHGRRLRAGMAAARLAHLRKSDEEAKQAGTVRAKQGGVKSGSGREALSLREKKRLSGEEKRERKERRGIGGVWGKEKGGSIKLSKDDLAKVRPSASSRGGKKGYRRK